MLQPNLTAEYTQSRPLTEFYAGHSSPEKLKAFSKFEGRSYVSVWERFASPDRVQYHSRNPYPRKVPLSGTDGFQFSPGLAVKDELVVFDTFSLHPITFAYHSTAMEGDLETYVYKLDVAKYANSEKFMDNFPCPILNLTSAYRFPLFVALPHYSSCTLPCQFRQRAKRTEGSLHRQEASGSEQRHD